MIIRIERGSSIPISRQIADQVRAGCLSGALEVGHRMPSVRELAKELGVNQNTVLRVYERLTNEGLLERIQGDGTYVRDQGTAGRRKLQQKQIADELTALFRRAQMLGLSWDEVTQLVGKVIQELSKGK